MTAGTVNIEGRLRVRVFKSGASTTMADILRLVEGAQSRAAPVQRLADTVAGRFAVGVMGCSLATLAFWSLAGPTVFPQVNSFMYRERQGKLQEYSFAHCPICKSAINLRSSLLQRLKYANLSQGDARNVILVRRNFSRLKFSG